MSEHERKQYEKPAVKETSEENVFLRGLTDYENPDTEDHKNFLLKIDAEIKRMGKRYGAFSAQGDAHAAPWLSFIEERSKSQKPRSQKEVSELDVLRSKVNGATVIDLGGSKYPVMEKVAEGLGAKVYIDVDRHFEVNGNPTATSFRDCLAEVRGQLSDKDGLMTTIYTKADMLLFLSKMHPESPGVVIALNGIDSTIIDDYEFRSSFDEGTKFYNQRLAEEIARVLPHGSIVMSSNSGATWLFEGLGLKLIAGSKEGWSNQIWIKE